MPPAATLDASGLPPVGEQTSGVLAFHASSVRLADAIADKGLRPNRQGYVAMAMTRKGVIEHAVGHAWFEFCHRRTPRASLAIAGLDDVLALDAVLAVHGSADVNEWHVRHASELRVFEPIPPSMLALDHLEYDFLKQDLYRAGLVAWLVDSKRWGQVPAGVSPYDAAKMLHAQSGAHRSLRLDDIVSPGSTFRHVDPGPSSLRSRSGVRDGTVSYLGREIPLMRYRSLG